MGRNYSADALKGLRLGKGETLHADTGLLCLKALLQSGVSYLGGYPGAPTSNLFDAISDAYDPMLKKQGIYFEGSGNEAAAAALLTASIDQPVRGAVNWKVVGTNVAADVLAHVAASGVRGGAMVFVGEDYGCDSTTVAEKTLPYAVKSGMVAIDPPNQPQRMVDLIEQGFALSEASHMPVFYLLRTRTGNLKGTIRCKDNRPPAISTHNRLQTLETVRANIPQPPFSFVQEEDKFDHRIPAARRFIAEHQLNQVVLGGDPDAPAIITHGAIGNSMLRALQILGLADSKGHGDFSLLWLHVIEPLVPEQIADFLEAHRRVLIVEEGMPNLIEQQVRALAHELGITTEIHGKDMMPMAGEYTPQRVLAGLATFFGNTPLLTEQVRSVEAHVRTSASQLNGPLARRSAVFCTGCPERPIFTALKIMQREVGKVHYAGDIGCYSMGSFAPFYITDSITGMGTSVATTGAMGRLSNERMISFMGDGTFWHSGLTTSFANAVYNNQDSVAVIFENGWTSMTGIQPNPSSEENNQGESMPRMSIEKVLRAMGVSWIERVNPYDLGRTLSALRKAYHASEQGIKVIISEAECQLERGRRLRGQIQDDLKRGKEVVDVKLGIDDDVCTGDHSCMRLNGCPSLTVKQNPNPLKSDEIATIVTSCVGCGLCGEIAHEAVLCPSFYEVRVTSNPGLAKRLRFALNRLVMARVAGISL